MNEKDFRTDIFPLLRSGVSYDLDEGYEIVEEGLLKLLEK